ncbi:MAG: acyl-ACP--UDP-N-acetylglucosamine O-acyltransferase [Acidobacteria bacterium]|nr:acyl-ACP--UDP-N-acetylglucosamine O-acyltransferase [Acidobacteriota bacterium]
MTEPPIHPTAVVHPGARLGSGTDVGPCAVIEEDVIIGQNCRIGAHAVIKQGTRMGDGNAVFEGAVLGGPPQDLKYSGGRSYLRIGNGNTFREGVTVHRGAVVEGETRIGNGNYLMAHAHAAHDCTLGDSIVIANNVALAGHIEIDSHAFISGGVVIHQFSRVGKHSMIGGNSKITQDVLPFFLVDGVPGRVRALNLVGLKREGFPDAEINNLKEASRILFQHGSLEAKLAAMSAIDSDHVRHLVTFIRSSRRGFHRMVRARSSKE